jgi:CheY-like chemotaxis protein
MDLGLALPSKSFAGEMIVLIMFSVLIVDDDSGFLALASRILTTMGLEVVAGAPDAATAVALAERLRPDGVLVDLGLPDRDGMDLAHELAALPWKPTVVLTSSDADAVGAFNSPREASPFPFVPKDQLADGSLLHYFVHS